MSDAVPCTPPHGWWIMMRELGSAERFPLRPARQQHRAHAGRQADADGRDIRTDVLHRVVDRQAGGDAAAGAVDVHVDVLVRVFRFQEQQLCDHQARDRVVDRRADEDDALLQQAGEDVIGAFAPAGLFDHHRDKLDCEISVRALCSSV